MTKRSRKKGETAILTNTPEKDEIEKISTTEMLKKNYSISKL